jgi:hypothetical protein
VSADTVDDLHAAEDTASSLAAVAADLAGRIAAFDAECAAAEHTDTGTAWQLLHEIRADLGSMSAVWRDYCRPTCGADGDPASDECPDDCCGCPCGHAALTT